MKAKIYTGIISALIFAALPVEAQFADSRNFRDGEATLVVNNYYDNYDYYYSSRINRFHRSYSAFSYYSPVFTETYWYNYQPWSWGISIYGGRTLFGVGFSYTYPVYNTGWSYGFNYGWYDPWYANSYFWGYDPFYYNWYSPVVVNINVRNRYVYRDWGWHGGSWWGNSYRPVYNTYNYYNTAPVRYSSRDYYSRPVSGTASNRSEGSAQRRESQVYQTPRSEAGRIATGEYGSQGSTSRRTGTQDVNNSSGQVNNRGTNNGNNRNSVENGNNGNFGSNNSNRGNNGNNNNSQTGGNNGNFDNRNNGSRSSAVTPAQRNSQPVAPQRSMNQSGSGSTTRNNAVTTPQTGRVSSSAPTSVERRSSSPAQSSVRSQAPARSSSSSVSRSNSTQSGRSSSAGNTRSSGSSTSKSSESSKSSSGQSSTTRRR